MRFPWHWAVVACGVLLSLAGCGTLGAVKAAAYQPLPIPTETGGYTNDAFVIEWERFQTRTLVDAYAKHGSHSPAWDGPAAEYAKSWVERLAWKDEAKSLEETLAAGKALIETGCDDPLMLYLHGLALHESGDAAQAEDLFRRAVEGFESSAYPHVHPAYAALRVATICGENRGLRELDASRYQAIAGRWLSEAMSDGSFAEGELRVILYVIDEISDDLWTDRIEALYQTLQISRDVHPYLRDVVGGWLHIELAWASRGGGWADSVSEEGWEGFEGNLAIARDLLSGAWYTYPDYPHAPTAMITVAMAGHADPGETERMWFDRAVAAHVDYREAYDALIYSMLPRWGGSHDEIYDFGVACAESKRYDTRVPRVFLECIRTIADDIGGDPDIWTRPEVRTRLNTVLTEYEKRAQPASLPTHQSMHAAVAWRSGDYATARRLIDALGDAVDKNPFDWEFAVEFPWAKAQTYAFTGPHGEDLIEAEKLASRGKKKEALDLYKAALPEVEAVASPFVRHRAETLRLEDEFSNGDWVPLKPKDGLAGWHPKTDGWTVEPDGALKGVDTGRLWIRCDADFGERLEFRGEVEFVRSPGKYPDAYIALRCPHLTRRDDVTLQLRRRQGEVVLSQNLDSADMVTEEVEIVDRNTFLIQVWDEDVNVQVNGKWIMRDEWVAENYPGGKKVVGFGTTRQASGIVLRFRNLAVRKLTEPPSV